METQVTAAGEAAWEVSGELTFATVAELWRANGSLFSGTASEFSLDLSAVSRADSAGLALLIEWMRSARADGKAVRFLHVPQQLLEIARISGLESILTLQHD